MWTLQHLKTKPNRFINCNWKYICTLIISTLFEVRMWLAFAAKSAESNDIAFFFASYLCKKSRLQKKKYFAQYVSKHGGGMQNFYDCI